MRTLNYKYHLHFGLHPTPFPEVITRPVLPEGDPASTTAYTCYVIPRDCRPGHPSPQPFPMLKLPLISPACVVVGGIPRMTQLIDATEIQNYVLRVARFLKILWFWEPSQGRVRITEARPSQLSTGDKNLDAFFGQESFDEMKEALKRGPEDDSLARQFLKQPRTGAVDGSS